MAIAKIEAKRDLCIGATPCVVAAGSVFELDGENKVILKQKGGIKNSGPVAKSALEDAGITDDQILTAAQSCPIKAIYLWDETGKQIYPEA